MFGVPRERTSDQARVMASEWFNALRRFGAMMVRDAVTKAIAQCKFWPTLSEIISLCEIDAANLKTILGIDRGDYFRAGVEPPMTPQEIEFRAAVVAAAKDKFGFKPSTGSNYMSELVEHEPVPASQSQTLSVQLLNSCAVRRAKNKPTCRYDCAQQKCDLRTKETPHEI